MRNDGVLKKSLEEADGIPFGVLPHEDRHHVQPAVGGGGQREEAPHQRHAELGDDRLGEPHAHGDPQHGEPALGVAHGEGGIGLRVHRFESSRVYARLHRDYGASAPVVGPK